jgi:hypothetical protein
VRRALAFNSALNVVQVVGRDDQNDTYTIQFSDGDMVSDVRAESMQVFVPVESMVADTIRLLGCWVEHFLCPLVAFPPFTV